MPAPRKHRILRLVGAGCVLLALLHGALILLRVPIARPFDWLLNLGPVAPSAELAAPADGKRRVVVLVHGMFRTSASLGRLGRSLQQHGYEVLAFDYPSNADRLEAHADGLREAVEARFAAGPVDELSFVGHSMGGLVVQQYLRHPDARAVASCVYLATPHRGAVLADLRKHWFLFRWAMGSKAALQLSPGDPFHQQPIPVPAPSGTIVGDRGEGNASIPGNDDFTVGVAEATFAGATDAVTLPVGHTGITTDPESIRQVLHFLRHRAFTPATAAR